MAENLMENFGEVMAFIDEAEKALSKEINEIAKSVSVIQDHLEAVDVVFTKRFDTIGERLDRIEAFLGMPKAQEPSKNGAKESAGSKHKKAPKGSFRIKAYDGENVFWYGGLKGKKPIWHKSDRSAKKFDTVSEAEDIAEESVGSFDDLTIEGVS